MSSYYLSRESLRVERENARDKQRAELSMIADNLEMSIALMRQQLLVVLTELDSLDGGLAFRSLVSYASKKQLPPT